MFLCAEKSDLFARHEASDKQQKTSILQYEIMVFPCLSALSLLLIIFLMLLVKNLIFIIKIMLLLETYHWEKTEICL